MLVLPSLHQQLQGWRRVNSDTLTIAEREGQSYTWPTEDQFSICHWTDPRPCSWFSIHIQPEQVTILFCKLVHVYYSQSFYYNITVFLICYDEHNEIWSLSSPFQQCALTLPMVSHVFPSFNIIWFSADRKREAPPPWESPLGWKVKWGLKSFWR